MNDSEEDENFPLSIEIDTGTKLFSSPTELVEWASNEKEYFSLVAGATKVDQESAYVWNTISTWIDPVTNFQRQYTANKQNPNQQKNILNNVKKQIEDAQGRGHLVTSSNAISVYSKKVATEHSNTTGVYTLANLMEIGNTPNKPKAQFGAYLAFQYNCGTKDTVKSNIEALNSIKDEWAKIFKSLHLNIKDNNDQINQEISEIQKSIGAAQESADAQILDQKAEFTDLVKNSSDSLQDITKTYDEKLALQSSVQYWKDKRKNHTKMLLVMGAVTVFVASLAGGSFVYVAYKYLNITLQDVQLWRLALMIAISTFGVWVTRLSSKIFISNLHLRTDADERVTMIQTYLALLREDSGPTENERQLILETLFRPSATGYINDDGPSSFHEVATSVLSRNRM